MTRNLGARRQEPTWASIAWLAGPHGVELAFRAHDPRLVGRWAAYRLTDTRGDLAAVGVVKVEDSGGSIYLTVVPTKPNVARAKPTPLVNTDLRGRLKLNPSG